MILTYHSASGNSAMTDLYMQLINGLEDKEQYVVTLPYIFNKDEFSNEYKLKIRENFSNKSKIYLRISIIKFVIKLYRKCKENNVDKIFIMCENNWHIIYLIPLIKLLNLKIYIWVHDPILHSGEKKVIARARKIVDKFIIKKAQKIIVSYSEAKEIMIEKYNINSEKIEVVWLPRMKNVEYEELLNRKRFEYKYDCIFFGRIEEYKGIDTLIDSISYLEKKYNQVIKTIIVGRGNESEKIKAKIKESNLDIEFINKYVSNYELAKYISESKIVVLPYKDATGTQTVQIANYYNKPVIANNVGSFKEYISEDNGILVDGDDYIKFAEAIHKVLNSDYEYKKFTHNIYKYFNDNFSDEVFIKRIKEIIIT